ncbi:MAG: zf-HC2 domain-containing protein [Oscillospiraceae bacterium]|nr:zf-HC2 domain-containing protein [Oscillospiraceae bacterium]MDE7170863.1 zf-HC2 domain-containing protein [Oscillospiraceae bacterium]
MKEIKCEVIRDLLPLYEDNAASEATKELVRKHLADCPECREELRKMRVPVSLPVDEDTQQVLDKIRARREQRARNKRIAIISAVSAVMLIVLFCLWYTRPRSWTNLVRTEEAASVFASLTNMRPYFGEGKIPSDWDYWEFWVLDEVDGDGPAAQLILDALSKGSYRASLGNLRNYTPFPQDYVNGKSACSLHLSMFTQEHQAFISVGLDSLGQMTVYTSWDTTPGFFVYQTDSALFDTLAAVIQEYGEYQE